MRINVKNPRLQMIQKYCYELEQYLYVGCPDDAINLCVAIENTINKVKLEIIEAAKEKYEDGTL